MKLCGLIVGLALAADVDAANTTQRRLLEHPPTVAETGTLRPITLTLSSPHRGAVDTLFCDDVPVAYAHLGMGCAASSPFRPPSKEVVAHLGVASPPRDR